MREPGRISIYLCGPTVYGPPHLGHGRATLVYDILRRYLEWSGIDVRLVSNITDIDDKIIDRAEREGREWSDITTKCENVWFRAMEGIDVLRPTDVPHATEWVDEMVEMISTLVSSGAAYATSDGVYLSVESVEGYGLLAHQSLDDMMAGGGEREVFGAGEKRHPTTSLSGNSRSLANLPGSRRGAGRPGWHSECVVMSLGLLGDGFDLHCGGQDLRFPHHENERAQAVALGREFARHWMHNGFVVDAEEKMSKSLGNVSNLLDLIEVYDPRLSNGVAAVALPKPGWYLCRRIAGRWSFACGSRQFRGRRRHLVRQRLMLRRWLRSGQRWMTISIHPKRWHCYLTRCAKQTQRSTVVTSRLRLV